MRVIHIRQAVTELSRISAPFHWHSPPARLFSADVTEVTFGSPWDEGARGTTVGTPGT